ncbi:Tn4651 auxiliary cointegrate resolution protein T, partial [hydrothermal vent metagenome]
MARGGINKALVQQALEALMSKGQNPSIDAIRVELGNTGSKSTIHRHLKELEEEASTRL